MCRTTGSSVSSCDLRLGSSAGLSFSRRGLAYRMKFSAHPILSLRSFLEKKWIRPPSTLLLAISTQYQNLIDFHRLRHPNNRISTNWVVAPAVYVDSLSNHLLRLSFIMRTRKCLVSSVQSQRELKEMRGPLYLPTTFICLSLALEQQSSLQSSQRESRERTPSLY